MNVKDMQVWCRPFEWLSYCRIHAERIKIHNQSENNI